MTVKWIRLFSSVAIALVLVGCGGDDEKKDESSNNDAKAQSEEKENKIDNTGASKGKGAKAAATADEEFLNIAHGGASGYAPEHTKPAYDKAIEMNADYLEMDIQMTADGVPVAFHDMEVDRLTDGQGRINDLTLEEVKELDAGSWFNKEYPDKADKSFEGAKIMTLEEIIAEYGMGVNYYIETKSPTLNDGIEEEVVEIAKGHGLVEKGNLFIKSFHKDSLQKIHAINEGIPLIQLLWWEINGEEGNELKEWLNTTPSPEDMTDEDFAEIREYAVGIGPHLGLHDGSEVIDEDFVQRARDNDLLVHLYTINIRGEMKRLIDWGVTGIFTDYPNRLDEVRP
ncbi:glycerophosphodiester phosphodiesterase [Salipaludibacillus sp. CF4.18]|uniref:glycerophosphodiester phosphodiesterase n=1 Tax=Salipaludibacillus sp. CF4.18 TaxID=3373081 RepID=UPI003EE697F2